MRAIVIELVSEEIETPLLSSGIVCWGLGGFVLERFVHALMPAILLRLTGFDEFGAHTELDPPNR